MKSQSHRFTNEKLIEILSLSQNATAIYTGEEITIQMANDEMISFWGKDRSIIGQPLADAVPELLGQPFLDLLRDVWNTGITYTSKNAPVQLNIDGILKTYYFDFVYRAINDDTGKVDCILHTATDVTELNINRNLIAHAKEQQEALNREQVLNLALTSANDQLGLANEDLAAALEELSATNDELKQTQDQLQQTNQLLETRVKERTSKIADLFQELEAANEELLASLEELAASEYQTRNIIEHAPFPIGVYTGPEMQITFANKAITDVWGKGSEVVGKYYKEVLPELENQKVYGQLSQVYATGDTFEARNQRIDLLIDNELKTFYFNYIFTPLRNASGQIYAVMNTAADVTDVVMSKQTIEKSAVELAELNEELAAINEEMVAVNEELATVNEELTASNEEQVSINNELTELYDQLRISQDELQLAIDAAGMGTFDLNPQSGRFTGNELIKSWFGLQPEDEIELSNATSVIAPADRARVNEAILKALDFRSGGKYEEYYTIISQENAEPRIVRAKGKALFNAQNQPTRLSGVLQDVTVQVTSHEKLQQLINDLAASEKKFRSLISQAPVAINVFKSKDLIIESANEKILEIWDKTEAINGQKFEDAVPEVIGQPFIGLLLEVLATGKAYYGLESKALILKGNVTEERYFNFVYQPVVEDDGSINSILHVATEVTEQVNARKEIADINTRLNIAIDAGALGSTEVDIASGNMICNEHWKKCFGRTKDEPFSYPDLFNAMLPQYRDKIRELVTIAKETNTIYKGEYEVMWPDGSIHWINAHGKARYDANGNAVKLVGIISDVTELKQDEQRKNDFIAMVSHELKTPLTSLTGYVQMLQRKASKNGDGFTAGALESANKQVRKMTTMINGFLNVSRLESGKIHIERQHFDMAQLIREVEVEFLVTVNTHKIMFSDIEKTMIEADRDKIGQVINNFISNAVKYSPASHTITVSCKTAQDQVIVAVTDQGKGIRPEDQQRLFERYYRVKDQPANISGFGIGLYLCAEVIHRHNGKIWVESELDKGSTFYFSLPLQ
jgi:two-component system sensor histidine kinase VicK